MPIAIKVVIFFSLPFGRGLHVEDEGNVSRVQKN